jgi:hypothetical protein
LGGDAGSFDLCCHDNFTLKPLAPNCSAYR